MQRVRLSLCNALIHESKLYDDNWTAYGYGRHLHAANYEWACAVVELLQFLSREE
jgi:hypothetical protein